MNDHHSGLARLNSRKYLILAVVATFSVWYAQHASAVHAIDFIDSLIYGVVQAVFGSLGMMAFFIGSGLLILLSVGAVVNLFLWRYFYGAALAGFWLGINLINVSILNGGEGGFSAKMCAAGYGCFVLATLAGVFFSREPVPEPKLAAEPQAPTLPLDDYIAPGFTPLPASAPPPKPAAWALPQSGRAILAVAALFGLYAVYAHGSDWLGALITPGASKDAWPTDFKAAMARASAEHKPVLLHFTGSDWCAYCQELDRNIINTATFRDYAAKNLVFVEVDLPRYKSQSAELKKQNNELAAEFDVPGFPTVILLNRFGKNIGEISGYPEGGGPKAYIADLEKFIKADGAK